MTLLAPDRSPLVPRVHLGEVVDLDELDRVIRDGFVAVKTHPNGQLRILNYTKVAQYEGRLSNPTVGACRGLIVDGDDRLVARPLAKFANVFEHAPVEVGDRWQEAGFEYPPLPFHLPFEVFDKVDGSLGIAYHDGDRTRIATRGSFTSTQARWASTWFDEHLADRVTIPEGHTYLFEIVYAQGRIVCNYDFEGLVLLGVIDTATGADLPIPADWPGRVVERFDFDDIAAVTALAGQDPDGSENREGFVVRFADGTRAKVKFGEYMRLHRLLTGLLPRDVSRYLGIEELRGVADAKRIGYILGMDPGEVAAILEAPRSPLATLLEEVPDEMNGHVRAVVAELRDAYQQVEAQAREILAALDPGLDRKSIAARISKHPLQAVMFAMLDGYEYRDRIWKVIHIADNRPFPDLEA